MIETRRLFLRKIGALLTGGAVAAALFGGCAASSIPVYRYDNRGGRIDLYLKWYPELLTTGGAIELLLGGEVSSIYVVRVSFGKFAAFSPVCADDGCRVEMEKNGFKCPCDGSRYDLDGTPVSGPSGKALRSFATTYEESTVRILVE